tara:strand:+ start:205 stop:516 length:312 start_codon:yes stop_codon:yes gene_type:complete
MVRYDTILGCVGWDFSEQKKIETFDYDNDKGKWVSFYIKKPKVKLRKYIDEKAEFLGGLFKKNKDVFRDSLIRGYNHKGIKGVDYIYKSFILEVLKQSKNGKK